MCVCVCERRTECWLWSFSNNVSSVPLGKWLSSFTRASKPNFCRKNTCTDRLRSRTSDFRQCFWLCMSFYLFYEIKALSIVHPVDIIPDQPFSMNTITKKVLKWQKIGCLPCALATFKLCFGVADALSVFIFVMTYLLYSSCSREKMCLLKYSCSFSFA